MSRRQFLSQLLRADTEWMLEEWASLSGQGRKLILDRVLDSQFASLLRWFTSDDNGQKIKRTSVCRGHPPILFSVEREWELFSELSQSLWKIWDPFVLRYGGYLFLMGRRQTVDNNTEVKAGIRIFMPLQHCSSEYICWCWGQSALQLSQVICLMTLYCNWMDPITNKSVPSSIILFLLCATITFIN